MLYDSYLLPQTQHSAFSQTKSNNSDKKWQLWFIYLSNLAAHAKSAGIGAKDLSIYYRAPQDAPSDSALALPDIDMFFDTNLAPAFPQFYKPLRQLSRQKFLTQWMQLNDPIL